MVFPSCVISCRSYVGFYLNLINTKYNNFRIRVDQRVISLRFFTQPTFTTAKTKNKNSFAYLPIISLCFQQWYWSGTQNLFCNGATLKNLFSVAFNSIACRLLSTKLFRLLCVSSRSKLNDIFLLVPSTLRKYVHLS